MGLEECTLHDPVYTGISYKITLASSETTEGFAVDDKDWVVRMDVLSIHGVCIGIDSVVVDHGCSSEVFKEVNRERLCFYKPKKMMGNGRWWTLPSYIARDNDYSRADARYVGANGAEYMVIRVVRELQEVEPA